MKFRQPMTALSGKLWQRRWYLLGALGLGVLLLLFGLSSRRNPPVVEIITTEAGPQTNATPRAAVQFTRQLPQRDVDVEAAGDHIAAAATYLKNRQSAAALHAMTQARSSMAHAIERRKQQGKRFDMLDESLKEIDSAEHYIQRGALGEARAHLISLNSKLDDSLER